MTSSTQHLSEWQMAIGRFKKQPMAMLCFNILLFLYFAAIFAGFLSPYRHQTEDRNYSYCPPTPVYFFDQNGLTWPYVKGITSEFNDVQQRIYRFDETKKYPILFLARGDEYKLWGVLQTDRHLFTVDAPGKIFLMGADARGRDVLSRILMGAQISLSIGLIGVMISFSIGLIVGGMAGYYGGAVDNFLMRLSEMMMMVPGFYLLLALRASVPPDFNTLKIYFSIIVIMSFIGWAGLARIIRGMCLSLRERDYVLAAKSIGLSDFQIILRHILPHTISYTIFAVMLSIPSYIMGESALSLIGLGIDEPFVSWGFMLKDVMSIVRIKFYPWILWPAFFIFLTVICFNIVGDALRDSFDPMIKSAKGR